MSERNIGSIESSGDACYSVKNCHNPMTQF